MEISNRQQYEIDHDRRDVDFYWGVASGGTHAALSRAWDDDSVPTPHKQMVSFATAMNGLWEGPDWFIDSGGAPDSIKANGGHGKSVQAYVDYLRDPPTKYGADPSAVNIERFALRDWPCEPQVQDALDLSVAELQQRTLEDHIRVHDAISHDSRLDAQPVAVLQGWEPHEYLECLDLFRDHGLVTDVIGLGSVCRRGGPSEGGSIEMVEEVAHKVRRNLPGRVDLHGFGLKRTMLERPQALTVFDSVDSAAWEYGIRQATKDGVDIAPPGAGMAYDDWQDFDDRGNPRYTWRNIQTCFAGYHDAVGEVRRSGQTAVDDWGADVTVDTLADWASAIADLDVHTDGDDGYALLKCVCGTIVDPGRPEPVPDPGCRHCQRSGVDIWDLHLAARGRAMANMLDVEPGGRADG